MTDGGKQAIRAALDAIPGSPRNMDAETCIEVTLRDNGYHVVHGSDLRVQDWNSDKRHRCPVCHAVAVSTERPRRWRVYECCRCAARFARWPRLARLLPFAGVCCPQHRKETPQ